MRREGGVGYGSDEVEVAVMYEKADENMRG